MAIEGGLEPACRSWDSNHLTLRAAAGDLVFTDKLAAYLQVGMDRLENGRGQPKIRGGQKALWVDYPSRHR